MARGVFEQTSVAPGLSSSRITGLAFHHNRAAICESDIGAHPTASVRMV